MKGGFAVSLGWGGRVRLTLLSFCLVKPGAPLLQEMHISAGIQKESRKRLKEVGVAD